jgi:hypothetical protein
MFVPKMGLNNAPGSVGHGPRTILIKCLREREFVHLPLANGAP